MSSRVQLVDITERSQIDVETWTISLSYLVHNWISVNAFLR